MNDALFPRDSKMLDLYLNALAEEMARRDLLRFVMRLFPAYRPAPHHRLIADTLWKVITGEIKRLIITMPPRHGKSTLASEFFPPFYLAHHPNHRVIATSYAVSLAYLFSRRARNIFEHPLFPFHNIKLAGDRGAVENWELAPSDEEAARFPGLEYRGGYLAAGVGGGVTGHGANLLVIDDPVKSIEEADSIVKRDRVWDWYTGTAYTRLQPGGAVVIIGTRWHHDDLIGRILESEEGKEFTVLHLPAIGADGSALWPEMYPLETLQKIRMVIGSRNFNAQYQGTPTEDEGGIVRWNWLVPYVRPPEDIADIWQSWDTSFGGSASADYSACLTVGNSPRALSLLSLWAKQVEFPQLVDKCIDLWQEWEPTEVLIENKASGQSLIQVLAQMPEARAMPVIPINPVGDKIARLYRVAPFIESGRVNRPQYAPWLEEFRTELIQFPLSEHDDRVDAFSQVVAKAFGLDDIGIAESTSYVQRSRYDDAEIDRIYARMRG